MEVLQGTSNYELAAGKISYFETKKARLSASPHPGGAAANSIIMRVPPIIRPHVRPQKAPGSVVPSQKTAITKTTAIGGQRKLETD